MESDSDEGREGELERLSGLTRTLEPASYCIGAIIRESESEGIEELVEREEFLHEVERDERDELIGEQIFTIIVFSQRALSLTAPQNRGRWSSSFLVHKESLHTCGHTNTLW